MAEEHKKDYPNKLAQYSPKIKAVAELLESDPSIGMEVILVTRYR